MAIMQLQQVCMIISILLLWCIITCTAAAASELAPAPPIAKPNCTEVCGNVSIPYPFGIGPNNGCYFNDWFEIECRHYNYSTSSKPFFKRAKVEVLSISIDIGKQLVQVRNPVTFFSCEGKETRQPPDLTGSPFVYSKKNNIFTAVSCGLLANVRSDEIKLVGGNVVSCGSICGNTSSTNLCNVGIDCCQTSIPSDISAFSIEIQSSSSGGYAADQIGHCKYAFLAEKNWTLKSDLSHFKDMDSVPVVLVWSLTLGQLNSSLIELFESFTLGRRTNWGNDDPTPYCSIYSDEGYDIATSDSTYNRSMISWISCACRASFKGNPYLLQSCQDIDECKNNMTCIAPDVFGDFNHNNICENFVGGYRCYSNTTGYICDYTGGGHGRQCYFRKSQTSRIKAILLGLGAGLGLLLLLMSAWLGYRFLKKRNNIKRKEMFFKQNGGLLLEQQLSSGEVNVEKIKLFKSKELEKSTDNFNNDRILGEGGQGTVYKGMLADGRIVAVKKSKIVDESQLSDFINEVVILSQINHRNVVQLLGCCLETEVPILVYEFIPNGTLSQYIHEHNEEFPLTWEIRLRIAMEIAGALSYLHASASSPIYHRDIKSTNILLDAKYRVKVADFGTSRSVAIDQTHLTTLVHGTFGYLDPEYFQSSQFTDKSDVYSFGVVLVELLTGQKPISFNRSQEEGKSLATYFIISMQLDRLFEILDAQVVKGGSKADIIVVANLARRCLNLNGRKRPTMREVTAELEGVQMAEKTSNGEQKYEEVEYVRTDSIEPWEVVSSSTVTGPVLDGDSPSLLHEIPLLSFKSL